MRSLSLSRRIVYSLIPLAVPYVAAESALTVLYLRGILGGGGGAEKPVPDMHPKFSELVEDMRRYLRENDLPALVVYVPWRTGALGGEDPAGSPAEARRFAESLGADFVDGNEAFDGMGRGQIRDCWLEYDGHWTQAGADRFARFMADLLTAWPGGDWQAAETGSREGGER